MTPKQIAKHHAASHLLIRFAELLRRTCRFPFIIEPFDEPSLTGGYIEFGAEVGHLAFSPMSSNTPHVLYAGMMMGDEWDDLDGRCKVVLGDDLDNAIATATEEIDQWWRFAGGREPHRDGRVSTMLDEIAELSRNQDN